MALSIFVSEFGTRKAPNRLRPWNSSAAKAAAPALNAVQVVVNALTDHKGGRFVVGFSREVQAGTDYAHRKMVVSSKPLFEGKLTLAEACDVMTGLACHEVGHVVMEGERTQRIVAARWPNSVLALKAHNLVEDVALERFMSDRFPGIAPTFRPMLRWVGLRTLNKVVFQFRSDMKMLDRFNFAVAASRYAFVARWASLEATRRERVWWQEWADTYGVDNEDTRIEGVRVALEHLREPNYDDENTPIDEPQPEPEQGEGEGNESEDDESEGEGSPQPGGFGDESDDESFDQSADFGDEDEDDEQEPGEGKSEKSEDEGDEDSESKGEGRSDSQPGNAKPDTSTDKPDLTYGEQGGVGGGTEQAFINTDLNQQDILPQDERKVLQTPHDVSEMAKEGYSDGRNLQRNVNRFRAPVLRRTDGWGQMPVMIVDFMHEEDPD